MGEYIIYVKPLWENELSNGKFVINAYGQHAVKLERINKNILDQMWKKNAFDKMC